MSADAAFVSHAAWVRSLRESYDSQRLSQHLEPDGDGDGSEAGSSASIALSAADPVDQLAHFDRALEFEDFDEPVYRSLVLAGYDAYDGYEGQDFASGHEPVYRCLGLEAPALEFDDAADSPMDSKWLATMPPLIHRQSGRMFD